MKFSRSLAVLALAVSMQCQAAAVDSSILVRLKADATKFGAAAVMVHLQDVSLESLQKNPAAVAASTKSLADAMFNQLGPHAWKIGRSVSPAGQATFYVTPQGLDILLASGRVKAFFAGQSWYAQAGMSDGGDGSFEEIDTLLARDGFVDLIVVPKVDGLRPIIDRSNRVRFTADTQGALAAQGAAAQVRAVLGVSPDTTASTPSQDDASFTVRVDRQGLLALVNSGQAIGFKPVGHVDTRLSFIDPKVQADVQKHGSTRVLVSIRTPLGGAKMPASLWAAMSDAHKSALADIVGGVAAKRDTRDLSDFGMLGATFTTAELKQLQASNDPRLLSVVSAVPTLSPHLTNVNAAMNTTQLRTLGYIGTGQNVILLDTGVEKTHPFLNENGASKVVFEACFGTNLVQGAEQYISLCPSQDASGDSPLGLTGSGSAIQNCSSLQPATCAHGTHMAGILVGKSATINGLAQGANLYSVQVGSQLKYSGSSDTLFLSSPEDIAAAVLALKASVAPGTVAAPYTIVAGMDGGAYASESICNNLYANFGSAVLYLKNADIAPHSLRLRWIWVTRSGRSRSCFQHALRMPSRSGLR